MIEVRNKCIFEAFENSEFTHLIHQVNMQRVMGSGIAEEIRSRYPEHYNDFKKALPRFGNYVSTAVDYGYIVGVFGQHDYGKGVRHTNYAALMMGIMTLLNDLSIIRNIQTIGIPHGIGCGLGGGDWDTVETILSDISKIHPATKIIIYKK